MEVKSRRYCSVPQCNSYKSKNISIHNFPTQPHLQKQWQIALKIGKKITKYMSVCSLHFEESDFHPNPLNTKKRFLKKGVVPTKIIPVTSIVKKLPNKKKVRNSPGKLNVTTRETSKTEVYDQDEHVEMNEDFIQNLDILAEVCDTQRKIYYKDNGIQCDIGNTNDKPIEKILKYSKGSFKTYTGVNVKLFDTFVACVENVLHDNEHLHISDIPSKILICLIKLKLNLPFKVMSGMFLLHHTSLKRSFQEMLPILRRAIDYSIYWPSIEENRNNMPSCFKKYLSTRVVLDCTEVPVGAPNCLKCRIRTYSHYKSAHTLKYLIGITPAGTISYVSPGYCGRTSDKSVFNDCEIINMLEPHIDSVMVDKGFYIDKECMAAGIKLIRPPYLRSQAKFTKQQAEMTADIAKAKIHVKRAIKRIKIFKILSEKITRSMVPFIDDAITIIASVTNLSNPIFKIKNKNVNL